jgi:hypothetical protein
MVASLSLEMGLMGGMGRRGIMRLVGRGRGRLCIWGKGRTVPGFTVFKLGLKPLGRVGRVGPVGRGGKFALAESP